MFLAVTSGIGNVMEKWEFTFRILQRKMQSANKMQNLNGPQKKTGNDDETSSILDGIHRCNSFDDLAPETDAYFDIENLSKFMNVVKSFSSGARLIGFPRGTKF